MTVVIGFIIQAVCLLWLGTLTLRLRKMEKDCTNAFEKLSMQMEELLASSEKVMELVRKKFES